MPTALRTLQKNASEFFDEIHKHHSKEMQCGKGCSACCYTDLHIFESEAIEIVEYINSLPQEERTKLISSFRSPPPGKDPTGRIQPPCSFLNKNQECVIYPARPLICRTQGAPLLFKLEESKKKKTDSIDHCPLNFKNKLPDRAHWIQLDRMNQLLSIAEKDYQIKEKQLILDSIKDSNERISLKKLKKWITQNNE